MYNWRDGVKRIPLHLATWGLGGVLASVWLGWIPLAFVLGAAIRGEYQDFTNGEDTVGKAIIDFSSQIVLPLTVALVRLVK
jgi:hypothetical protein